PGWAAWSEARMADCIFWRIAGGEIPASGVQRAPGLLDFRAGKPVAPTHVLIIPTDHLVVVRDAKGESGSALLGRLLGFAAEVAAELGLDAGGQPPGT